MAVGTITKRTVDALKKGEADQYLWDDEVSGFGLKVTPKNARTYILQYRMGGRGTPTKRFTIGRHGTWTPEEARKEAKRLRQMVDRGIDPQAEQVARLVAEQERQRRGEAFAFSAYVDRFLEQYGKREWRAGTYDGAEANFRLYVKPQLGKSSLLDITRADVTAMLDTIPVEKPALRRSVYAYTRKLFAWAVGRGDLEKSPMDGMSAPSTVASRDRVLGDPELRLVWLASKEVNGLYGRLVRLLLLTGQRRDEVSEAEWAELDRDARLWTIPGARTKNGLVQLVPLSDAVVEELDALAGAKEWPRKGLLLSSNGKTSFSGFSKCKAALDKEMKALAEKDGMEWQAWKLHDLRRTLATGMQRLGIRFEVTEAVLNHVSGSKAGVAGVYQRHDWKDEKRAALDAWARHIASILAPAGSSNVVQLRA